MMKMKSQTLMIGARSQTIFKELVWIGITVISSTVELLKNGVPYVQATGAAPTKRNWLQQLFYKWRIQ